MLRIHHIIAVVLTIIGFQLLPMNLRYEQLPIAVIDDSRRITTILQLKQYDYDIRHVIWNQRQHNRLIGDLRNTDVHATAVAGGFGRNGTAPPGIATYPNGNPRNVPGRL